MDVDPTFPHVKPVGDFSHLMKRPDADRIAYTLPSGPFGKAHFTRYENREQMLKACRPGSRTHALVKTAVAAGMVKNPNVEFVAK